MKQNDDNFFITTAIAYTNGPPHIGHLYEYILSDIIAKFSRICGKETFFLTGSDEHGQKISDKSKSLNKQPLNFCDENVELFTKLNKLGRIDYSNFIRTSSTQHKETVHKFYNICKAVGDIYKGAYEGWYLKREERFVTDREAELTNFKDPVSGDPYIKVEEPSYFFKLSKYVPQIIELIESDTIRIVPATKKQLILKRLKVSEIRDLSISRVSVDWGIPLPDDPEHTFYVWFDALTNYLSGISYFENESETSEFWPPDVHVIGKDITWFHSVIWTGMLLSAKLQLPKAIYVHSFVNDEDNRKMSKSLGNVVDPFQLLNQYSSDSIRYFCAKETGFDNDLKFSVKHLIDHNDGELASKFGNLVTRIIGLIKKYCGNKLPKYCETLDKEIFDLQALYEKNTALLNDFRFDQYIENIFSKVDRLNDYINETHVWTIGNPKKPEDTRTDEDRQHIIRQILEGVLVCAHYLWPIIPESCEKVLDWFGFAKFVELEKLSWENFVTIDPENLTKSLPDSPRLFQVLDDTRRKSRLNKNGKKRTAKNNK